MKQLEVLLGDEDGEASLFLTSHSIHASIIPRERHYREIRAPIRTLDSLVAAGEVAIPDVIKIDVEGSELKVFKGAKALLRDHQPSIVFEADENMRRIGYTADDLLGFLAELVHYEFFLIDDVGSLTRAGRPYPFGNFLALSPRHAKRI
jgi:hypothetical protein